MISPKKQRELKDRYDMVVFLKEQKEYSFSEIAKEFKKSRGWAHWAYKKAKHSHEQGLLTGNDLTMIEPFAKV
jgi:DNA-directed RNA polymerase specialized sigma24 family protein